MDIPYPIRVLSADDHDLVRKGIDLIGEAKDSASVIDLHRELRTKVTLMDLRLPDQSGIETHAVTIGLRRDIIHLHSPELRFLPNG